MDNKIIHLPVIFSFFVQGYSLANAQQIPHYFNPVAGHFGGVVSEVESVGGRYGASPYFFELPVFDDGYGGRAKKDAHKMMTIVMAGIGMATSKRKTLRLKGCAGSGIN